MPRPACLGAPRLCSLALDSSPPVLIRDRPDRPPGRVPVLQGRLPRPNVAALRRTGYNCHAYLPGDIHGMKRSGFIVLVFLAAVPAWSAKKVTVAELTDMLTTLHQQNKTDAEVSDALKQVQLTEELTRGAMNSLVPLVPGKLSTEQIYVLEARSAVLPPPPSEVPATAPLDAAAQQALLAKAQAYATSIYAGLPNVTATRTTLRFQDNVEAVNPGSGLQYGGREVTVGSHDVNASQFVHYYNASEAAIAIERGVERFPQDKTRWGANRMIALTEPGPNLTQVFREAQDAGSIRWLRWEIVGGKTLAVFFFQVPKKKTHLAYAVCCFPNMEQAGVANFTSASGFGAPPAGGPGGPTGNLQTNADWHPYKATPPYHGEFFIDPDSGTMVRMITQAEFKPGDVVHQVDTRIDYSPVSIGGKSLVLPQETIAVTEVVPYGESGAGAFSTRCTLFTSKYKDYRLADAAATK